MVKKKFTPDLCVSRIIIAQLKIKIRKYRRKRGMTFLSDAKHRI